jgi:hypothetical protein
MKNRKSNNKESIFVDKNNWEFNMKLRKEDNKKRKNN